MATSSEYYRTASTPSHYQPFPTPHYDHLYATPAAPWHEPTNDSYAGPSPAPFLHYAQGAPSGDYVNSSSTPQQPALPSWPTSYAPIHHAAHVVSDSTNPEGFGSRPSIPYGDVEGQPIPHSSAGSARQHQHQNASTSIHDVHLVPPEDHFRQSDRTTDLRISSDIPAQPVDPPVPSHTQNSHTIPRLLYPRSQTAPVPPHPSQLPLQPHLAWDAGSDVPPPIEQQHSSHPSDSIVAVSQHNASSPPWAVFHTGGGTFVPPVYERVADVDQQWPLIPAQPSNNGDYTHHSVPLDQVTDPAVAFQTGRRASTKKKAAKVPSSYVERQEKLKVSRRKGPLAEDKREKTHFMRKNKRICVRCRFYKSGCDDGDPCQKCDKIEGHARSFREPCYREHLEDTSLVRRCNGRFNQEEAEFLGYDWIQGSKLYEMEIIWNLPGFGPLSMHPMRITFRSYFPKRAVLDTATSVWRNTEGEVKAVEQPPYAIYDTASLIPAFERYFSSLQPDIERWIFERVRHDEVAFLTYQEVNRIRGLKQSKLLDLAMRLQCLSVVSQGYGSVFSNNIPGIREYDYRKLGRSNYEAYDRNSRDRPLPGAINHQMDVAALKYLKKLEKVCVKELAGLIFKPKIKPWYELFLAFYVIFWNLEYIHRGAERYILSKNGTLIENSVSNVVSNQIKKWDFAFPVLLYHWRCTLRGYSPFRLARDNPEELRERGHIDAEGFQYVTKVASIFDRSGPDRYPPPLTGFPAAHICMSSEWIVKLFKEAGA